MRSNQSAIFYQSGYHRQVSLESLWFIFVEFWGVPVAFSAIFTCAGFFYAESTIDYSFASKTSFVHQTKNSQNEIVLLPIESTATFSLFHDVLSSSSLMNQLASDLCSQSVTHNNGLPFTSAELSDCFSFPTYSSLSPSAYYRVTFSLDEGGLAGKILLSFSKLGLESLKKTNETFLYTEIENGYPTKETVSSNDPVLRTAGFSLFGFAIGVFLIAILGVKRDYYLSYKEIDDQPYPIFLLEKTDGK